MILFYHAYNVYLTLLAKPFKLAEPLDFKHQKLFKKCKKYSFSLACEISLQIFKDDHLSLR